MTTDTTPKRGYCPHCRRAESVVPAPKKHSRSRRPRFECVHCHTVWQGVRK